MGVGLRYFSRYGNWNSLKSLIRYPGPVCARLFRDVGRQDERILADFLGVEERRVRQYYDDLYKERSFFKNLGSCQTFLEKPEVRGGVMDRREAAVIYAVTRHLKVGRCLETGVGSGFSSAHILLALHHNQNGELCSIDLPNTDAWLGGPRQMLPEGMLPGWAVPEHLKSRWTLLLGDARVRLPEIILQSATEVDMFLHDSLHTYEHMMWEFQTIWPRLRPGGVLIADDADSNRAIHDFGKKVGRVPLQIYGLGMIQKR